jgi:proliferating cell nuclear antigen
LFEAELSNVEPLRNLIKAISVVVEEGSFRVDEGQMRLLAMDPSHVAMVDFELPKEFFDRYSAEGEVRLSMNMRELLKFLDRVERGEQLKIRLDEEQSRVILECRRGGHIRTFTLPLIEPMEEEVPSPKIFFKSSARLLTQSLRRAIRDASLVSEHVRIEMTSKELRIQASGEAGSVSSVWEMGADDLLELKAQEDSRATFTISYLQDMINAAAMSSEVTSIELSTDMPIKMNFELPQGKLIYYLAPCIGV